MYKFCNIFVNFEHTKIVDHIFKISKSGVFDIRCLSLNTAIIVLMKNAKWIEDDIKVVTEFPSLLGYPVVYISNLTYFIMKIRQNHNKQEKFNTKNWYPNSIDCGYFEKN